MKLPRLTGEWVGALLVVGGLAWVLIAMLLMGGCCKEPQVRVVQKPPAPCIEEPPPECPEITLNPCPMGALVGNTLCFDRSNSAKLIACRNKRIRTLRRWHRLCGGKEATNAPTHSPDPRSSDRAP